MPNRTTPDDAKLIFETLLEPAGWKLRRFDEHGAAIWKVRKPDEGTYLGYAWCPLDVWLTNITDSLDAIRPVELAVPEGWKHIYVGKLGVFVTPIATVDGIAFASPRARFDALASLCEAMKGM